MPSAHRTAPHWLRSAATAGLHWIYDQAKVAELVAAHDHDGVFYSPSACPFYQVPDGDPSCYGNEVISALQAVASVG